MKALRYQSRDLAEIVELPVPEPGPGEVLLRVEAAGICRTDLEILAGNYSAKFPVTPGHEFAGTVVGLGAGVDPGWSGRLAAVDPLVSCGVCRWCVAGRINLCADFRAYGSEIDGGLAEFSTVRAENLVEATGLVPQVAALAEPLGCAENGAFRAAVSADDKVLVVGAGPIGLLILTAFGRRGAALSLVEPQTQRLARGELFGATARFASLDEAMAATDGYDVVVDVTGRPAVVQQAVGAVGKGGRLLLFGVCPIGSELVLDPHDIYAREITVLGSFSLNRTLPAAIESLRTTSAPMAELVTHRLPLHALPGAFSLIGGPDALKVQVAPQSS